MSKFIEPYKIEEVEEKNDIINYVHKDVIEGVMGGCYRYWLRNYAKNNNNNENKININNNENLAAIIDYDGKFATRKISDIKEVGIRPAIWVSLKD